MEKVQEITDQMETGITELFNSERYAAYLSTMSKFHRYSFGNILLILLQCPGASQVYILLKRAVVIFIGDFHFNLRWNAV